MYVCARAHECDVPCLIALFQGPLSPKHPLPSWNSTSLQRGPAISCGVFCDFHHNWSILLSVFATPCFIIETPNGVVTPRLGTADLKAAVLSF